tara:strand:- start:2535 stop:2945 length:411 start_codon:yes stop_codon:yes gene_type:complete
MKIPQEWINVGIATIRAAALGGVILLLVLFPFGPLEGCKADPQGRSALDGLGKSDVPRWCNTSQASWGKLCKVSCPIYRDVYLSPMEVVLYGKKMYLLPSSQQVACDRKLWEQEREQIRLQIIFLEQQRAERQGGL